MKSLLFVFLLFAQNPLILSGQGAAEETTPSAPILFLVSETQLEEGQSEAYFELFGQYIAQAEKVAGFRLPHFSYRIDNNMVVHTDMIQNLADIDALHAQGNKERQQIGEGMQALMDSYFDMVDDAREYVVEYHPDLAYFPEGDDAIPAEEEQYFRWMFLDFDFENYFTIMELAGEIRDLQTEFKSTTTTRIYTNYFGGPAGQLIVQHGARDAADLERLLKIDEERMMGEAYKSWDERARAITTPNRIITGAYMPDFSAPPE